MSTPSQMSKHTTAPAKDALQWSVKKGAIPHAQGHSVKPTGWPAGPGSRMSPKVRERMANPKNIAIALTQKASTGPSLHR